jgi:hypothetical protein
MKKEFCNSITSKADIQRRSQQVSLPEAEVTTLCVKSAKGGKK